MSVSILKIFVGNDGEKLLREGSKILRIKKRIKRLHKLDDLTDEIEKNIRYTWKIASTYIPFYKRLYNRQGISIRNVDDIQKLPVVTPEYLAEHSVEFHNPYAEPVSIILSSGTTYKKQKTVIFSLDNALAGYEILERLHYKFAQDLSIKKGDIAIILFPQDVPFQSANLSRMLSTLYGLTILPVLGRAKIDRDLEALLECYLKIYSNKRIHIFGYPSLVVDIDKQLNNKELLEKLPIESIIMGGEPVSGALREEIARKLQPRNTPLDIYGVTEGGVLGSYTLIEKYVSLGDRILIIPSDTDKEILYSILFAEKEMPSFIIFNYRIGDVLVGLKEKNGYYFYDGITRKKYTIFIGAAMFTPDLSMPFILRDLKSQYPVFSVSHWKIIRYYNKYGLTRRLDIYISGRVDKLFKIQKESFLKIMDLYASDPAAALRKGIADLYVYLIPYQEFERRFPEVAHPETNPNKKAKHIDEILIEEDEKVQSSK